VKRFIASGGVLALLSLGLVTVSSVSVHAATTISVTTVNDENGPASDCTDANPATLCSLREAVAAATTDGDTIQLPGGTYLLTNGVITHGDTLLAIVGAGLTATTVDAQQLSKFLEQGTGTLSLQGFSVTNGKKGGGLSQDGGAVEAKGDVVLDAMSFSGNTVGSDIGTSRGGAVYAAGAVTATNSVFTGNTATTGDADLFHSYGGAIYAGTVATVQQSEFTAANGADSGGAVWGETGVGIVGGTFEGNTGHDNGGAVGTNGIATVTQSFFDANDNSGGQGGAVYAEGALVVSASTFERNTASSGGAIFSKGAVDGSGLDVFKNVASSDGSAGGGIFAGTTVTLDRSSVVDNLALDEVLQTNTFPKGGGIAAHSDVTITSSNVSLNVAKYDGVGGGIYSSDGKIEVIESTVSNNFADHDPNTNGSGTGGGLAAPRVVLRFATVASNGGTTGANIAARSLQSTASVVASASGGGTACALGSTTSTGYNYDDDGSCGFAGPHDVPAGPDPLLGPLADNGGGTLTMHPLPGSALIDAVPASACAGCDSTDQRGVPRPQGGGYDIGAVEVIGGVAVSPRFTG